MTHLRATSVIVQPPFGSTVSQGDAGQDCVGHTVMVGVVGQRALKPGMRTCSPVTVQGSAGGMNCGQSIPGRSGFGDGHESEEAVIVRV